jgi:hypothetical protein
MKASKVRLRAQPEGFDDPLVAGVSNLPWISRNIPLTGFVLSDSRRLLGMKKPQVFRVRFPPRSEFEAPTMTLRQSWLRCNKFLHG